MTPRETTPPANVQNVYRACWPVTPLRAQPTPLSEQVSQLLFGEALMVEQVQGVWHHVTGKWDGYSGWVPAAVLAPADCAEWPLRTLSHTTWLVGNERLHLPAGCRVPGRDFHWAARRWTLLDGQAGLPLAASREAFVERCASLLGLPYLWGGRSPYGCDCSGLMQWAAGLMDLPLRRDAWQQAEQLPSVDWGAQQAGDLAFFANASGRVTHVGVLETPGTIIHAVGSSAVRRDELTAEGIYNLELKKITHTLYRVAHIL